MRATFRLYLAPWVPISDRLNQNQRVPVLPIQTPAWSFFRGGLVAWAAFGAGLALASDSACIGINSVKPECKPAEPPYHRDVFFIGGDYVTSGTSYIFSDQLYVEKLTSTSGVDKTFPIVFISAGIPAGNVWLNTPDNRKGWAVHFLERGTKSTLSI